MLCKCIIVPMYKVKEMLLFDASKLCVIVEEIVVCSIYSVDILIEKVLCGCHFEEELWVVGWRYGYCCDLLSG